MRLGGSKVLAAVLCSSLARATIGAKRIAFCGTPHQLPVPTRSTGRSRVSSSNDNRRNNNKYYGTSSSHVRNMANLNHEEVLAVAEKVPNRVALCQFQVTESKEENHATARAYLKRAADAGASMAILPEIWNSPYATSAFSEYAEPLPSVGTTTMNNDDNNSNSPSAALLREAAHQWGMTIVGGSIPEVDHDGKLYNTCLVYDKTGTLLAKHRKVHLFDIDIPGGITFRESDTLSPGTTLTAFDAGEPFGMVGLGICYDIRFPEYALLLNQKYQCQLLIYPGAFNMTTGPAHWELLQKARAVDNQCFVLTASPARSNVEDTLSDHKKYPHYTAWGHSTVVAPWGTVVATCDEAPTVLLCDLDLAKVEEMRTGIPTRLQKRPDLYQLTDGIP